MRRGRFATGATQFTSRVRGFIQRNIQIGIVVGSIRPGCRRPGVVDAVLHGPHTGRARQSAVALRLSDLRRGSSRFRILLSTTDTRCTRFRCRRRSIVSNAHNFSLPTTQISAKSLNSLRSAPTLPAGSEPGFACRRRRLAQAGPSPHRDRARHGALPLVWHNDAHGEAAHRPAGRHHR